MEGKELRVGNLISRLDLGDNSLRIETVLEIKENKVLTTGPISVNCLYSEINPIPLTEEWLLNFLFTKLDNLDTFELKDGNYRSIQIDLNSNGIEIYLCGTDSVMSSQCFPVDNVKYVHQLQNLFFALTGEELTIKQLAKI